MIIHPETLDFIAAFQDADPANAALQGKKYPKADLPFALNQIAGRQTAIRKLPSWAAIPGLLYPPHLSMEQCSSERTARYKAELIGQDPEGKERFADLTAGFGVDFACIAPLFRQATYIERQSPLCELARHNFPRLQLEHVTVFNGDGLTWLEHTQPLDWLLLDPARRDKHGGKVVAISDCEPDVAQLEPLLIQKARHTLIKLSPMLDITLALHTLRHVEQVHVVAVEGECKELLLVLGQEERAADRIPLYCINLLPEGREQHWVFTREEEAAAPVEYAFPQHYLYEPNAAVIKAGAFRILAARLGLKKLHPNSHLYTSEEVVPSFPGRIFQVDHSGGFSKNEVSDMLNGVKRAHLTTRNFPQSVAGLRKKLKLQEGGDIYLFATTLHDGHKALIRCHKPIIS